MFSETGKTSHQFIYTYFAMLHNFVKLQNIQLYITITMRISAKLKFEFWKKDCKNLYFYILYILCTTYADEQCSTLLLVEMCQFSSFFFKFYHWAMSMLKCKVFTQWAKTQKIQFQMCFWVVAWLIPQRLKSTFFSAF